MRPSAIVELLGRKSNFFRIHLFYFTFTPLLLSGILYASNGRFHVAYIDCLFLCYSAMTANGLTTADLSPMTAWQQTILYMLMALVRGYRLQTNIRS